MSDREYAIVKHANENHWPEYFDSNPQDGVHISHSASYTHSGKEAGIKVAYDNLDDAKIDCQKMNEQNPCGYAVCPLIPS